MYTGGVMSQSLKLSCNIVYLIFLMVLYFVWNEQSLEKEFWIKGYTTQHSVYEDVLSQSLQKRFSS